jgi:NAD(P)-dependent dehydrogenase (short-subunit alcohol dehydrogenase family)
MGKLDGKVAVITAATSGMALATAKLFVEEGAYVFITGRRKDKLDEAVKMIGRNVTGVEGDFASLIPRREISRPEEIATAALFLASSDSGFVNGIELFVDGGVAQI